MDPLSSSLETLVLSYRGIASLSTVSHLWTWVAILTAAISLWRIKAVSGAAPSRGENESLQKATSPENPDGGKHHPQSAHLQTPPSPVPVRSGTASVSPSSESNCGSLDFCMNGDCREAGRDPPTSMARNPSGLFFRRWEGDSEYVSEMGRVGCTLCEEGRGKFDVYFDGDGHDIGGDGCFGAVEGFGFCGLGNCVDADNCAVACGFAPLVGREAEWPWYHNLDLTVLNGNVVRLWDDVSGRKPPVDWASGQVFSLF
ncbi:uncharacterized protein LOC116264496 [Nymphaea colorata]|uniref:uncharacterized protein LOC116264496 n=1 Tax=Nymphaea colorata TaxID=210225 RepID=UPI00129D6C0A|nr:uncharacterized protein LOC116264496 [Nymphaea colorata]